MPAELKFIGHIETPYHSLDECPRNTQPNGPDCKLFLRSEFKDGLMGLVDGQEILILYWFENVDRNLMQQTSRRTGKFAGVFALRTPNRPNPIGAAVLKIEKVEFEQGIIHVKGLDCLNGTPLIDIKPAIFDERINPDSPNQFFRP